MSDLISRADAIEAVESADPKDREYHYYKHIAIGVLSALPSAETTGALDDAIAKYVADGLMELPSAGAEWIPCSERLPSEDGRYLVCMSWEYDNMEVLKWADGWNCFRCPDGKVSRESEIDGADVIAWMPKDYLYQR